MKRALASIAPYWKAVAGFIAPGVALFIADYSKRGSLPSQHQWVAIAVACVAGAVGVYFAPKNAAPATTTPKETA